METTTTTRKLIEPECDPILTAELKRAAGGDPARRPLLTTARLAVVRTMEQAATAYRSDTLRQIARAVSLMDSSGGAAGR